MGSRSRVDEQVGSSGFSDWTARAGAQVRDFPGAGRVVVERVSRIGSRVRHCTARIRREGADTFAWEVIEVPSELRKSEPRTLAWLDSKFSQT